MASEQVQKSLFGKVITKPIDAFFEKNTFNNLLSKDETPNIYQDLKNGKLACSQHHQKYHFETKREKQQNNQELKKNRPLHQSTTTELKTF